MATPRHSGNRGIKNLLAESASLFNSLIPLARVSQIGRKYSQYGGLPCVIFLGVARWWKPIAVITREKATSDPN
jgi:hypothetical protein